MLFSVIIPVYNGEKFIERSIKSVLNQTFTDFELIVINDGSKDKSSELARKFSDSRLTVIDKINEGVSVARNTGIKSAKGEFICFLDADDEFYPEHLDILFETIKNNNDKHFFSTNYCVTTIDGNNIVSKYQSEGKTYYYDNMVEQIIKASDLICTCCVCIRKSMFDCYGMFEPGVKLSEDTDMWMRVYVHTGVVYIDKITVNVNRDGSNATKDYNRNFESDPLNRMQSFMCDKTISENVKLSIKKFFELKKLQSIRSYLFIGNKKKAFEKFSVIDKSIIPKKRLLITLLCFFIPSSIIRYTIKIRNKGLYK